MEDLAKSIVEDTMVPYVTEEDAVAKAHKAREGALGQLFSLQLHRLGLGQALIQIEAEGLWEHLGFENFESFCSAPIPSGGLSLNARTRQALMQVYRVYVMELDVPIDKLQEISWSNLRTIISVVNKNNVATLLPEALTLANADLREKKITGELVGELVGEPVPLDAEKEQARHLLTCPNCNHEFESH